MNVAANENGVIVLMRALPKELADRVLARLKPTTAERLRDRLASQVPDAPDALERALREFADIQRIVDRVSVSAPTTPAAEATKEEYQAQVPASSDDPMFQLRKVPPDALLGVLRFEQPVLVANVLSCLDATAAAELLKRLPNSMRPAVTLKLSQPQSTNHELMAHLARAVVAQSSVEITVQPEPTEDERVLRTAAMLRALPRDERGDVLKKMEEADANFAKKVADQLYQFTDILRLDDRAMQAVLSEVDLKTVAMSLSGADDVLTNKISANLSSRAREALADEMSLIANPSKAKIEEAQASVIAVLRRLESEGKLSLEG